MRMIPHRKYGSQLTAIEEINVLQIALPPTQEESGVDDDNNVTPEESTQSEDKNLIK